MMFRVRPNFQVNMVMSCFPLLVGGSLSKTQGKQSNIQNGLKNHTSMHTVGYIVLTSVVWHSTGSWSMCFTKTSPSGIYGFICVGHSTGSWWISQGILTVLLYQGMCSGDIWSRSFWKDNSTCSACNC